MRPSTSTTCLLVVISLLVCAPHARAESRTRSGVSLLGQFGVGGPVRVIGPALAFDLGSVVSPEWALSARLSAGGILTFNMARLGLGAEYSAGERWTFGFGFALAAFFSFVPDLPGALSVLAPVRVDFALGDHGPLMLKRQGWILSLEVLPGVAFDQSCGFRPGGGPCNAPLTLVGLIGVGYAWR